MLVNKVVSNDNKSSILLAFLFKLIIEYNEGKLFQVFKSFIETKGELNGKR